MNREVLEIAVSMHPDRYIPTKPIGADFSEIKGLKPFSPVIQQRSLLSPVREILNLSDEMMLYVERVVLKNCTGLGM